MYLNVTLIVWRKDNYNCDIALFSRCSLLFLYSYDAQNVDITVQSHTRYGKEREMLNAMKQSLTAAKEWL